MSELLDNRAQRIRTLKEIIQRLHQGVAPEEVRGQLKRIVQECDASEIAAMEQELMAAGMSVDEVRSMCDLHSAVLRDILTKRFKIAVEPGHPIDTFRRENSALRERAGAMRQLFAEAAGSDDDNVPVESAMLHRLQALFNELMDIEKHYQRKENLLFSCLERHEITGPSKVMWAKDDEVRALLDALGETLQAGGLAVGDLRLIAETLAEPALAAIEEMIYKEENILLPMAQDTLTEDEWGEIWSQSPEYGWCIVEPREGYCPPQPRELEDTLEVPGGRALVFSTGALTMNQLQGIFSVLPVDLTFVDADDRVRYFSEGPDRVFARSKAIIGRKVHHCHPPKSVDIVDRILSDFRSGRQSVAEFWIEFQGRFVHIRYFAVRDQDGEYLGTLEMTQDITRLRALEGERRLLEYDTVGTGGAR